MRNALRRVRNAIGRGVARIRNRLSPSRGRASGS